MKVFLIAAVAVAISGAAFAKDLKGTVMTDSEMDKVTAGGTLSVDPTSTPNFPSSLSTFPGAGSPSVFTGGQAVGSTAITHSAVAKIQ
jgi:hypothetical protein